MNILRRILFSIETSRTSLGLWMVAFLCLILSRLLVESWLFGFESRPAMFLWYEFTHNFLFFLLSFLLFLPLFQYFARVSLSVASNMLLFGFLVILLPPVIDFLVSDGKGLWSFYIFDGLFGLVSRYFTFFGDRPDMGITYGVRVEVALVTVFFGYYVFLKTKQYLRAFCAALSAYSLLFFLGTFPSWAAMVILGISDGRWMLRAPDVAGVFLSPLSFFSRDLVDPRSLLNVKMSLVYATLLPCVLGIWLLWRHRMVFLALFRNARLPQAVYHVGLLFVGMGFAVVFSHPKLSFGLFDILAIALLVVAVVSVWLASVVPNDCFDTAIDCETNPTRPLPSGAISRPMFAAIGAGFLVTSLLFAALVSMKGALFLLLYQAIAWGYSSPPLSSQTLSGCCFLRERRRECFDCVSRIYDAFPRRDACDTSGIARPSVSFRVRSFDSAQGLQGYRRRRERWRVDIAGCSRRRTRQARDWRRNIFFLPRERLRVSRAITLRSGATLRGARLSGWSL
jgi:hypothetical protein